MIVLDTNIVSELQKPVPSSTVAAWLSGIGIEETFVCGPVLMEQTCGAEKHFLRSASARYRETLRKLRTEFAERTLPMDVSTWQRTGELRAVRDSQGRPIAVADAMIAAICLVHGATLATRNARDFEGLDLDLVNPFETTD